jgi:hypothetical protein
MRKDIDRQIALIAVTDLSGSGQPGNHGVGPTPIRKQSDGSLVEALRIVRYRPFGCHPKSARTPKTANAETGMMVRKRLELTCGGRYPSAVIPLGR